MLALARLDLVAAKVFLGFAVPCVHAGDRVVFADADFLGRVLRILGGVVGAVTGKLAHEANQLALRIFLSHMLSL